MRSVESDPRQLKRKFYSQLGPCMHGYGHHGQPEERCMLELWTRLYSKLSSYVRYVNDYVLSLSACSSG